MLNVIKCPNCRKLIETNLTEGQGIACPYCAGDFTISPAHAARRVGVTDALFRLAIPLGYVLFVGVPLGATVWYLMRVAEDQPDEVAETRPAQVGQDNRKEPKPPPRPPRKKQPKTDPDESGGGTDPALGPKPAVPVETEPEPRAPLAPPPRELPEVFVAPEPREIVWKIPLREYSSKWQKVGAVDIRVAGLAITKVPIVDSRERVNESAAPLFVVLIEVRLNTANKLRTLTSWTHGLNHYAAIFLENGKELPPAALPPGARPNTGLAHKQPLPDDGNPMRDVLLFEVPRAEAGELSLRLEAERCGESGDVWFKIPASAFTK